MAEPSWGAIPRRANGDRRLKEIHFRALSEVARRDCLSLLKGRGQGCWASLSALSDETQTNRSSLSTALNALVRWGYLQQERHTMNRRTKVYRVIYDRDSDSLPLGKPSRHGDASAMRGDDLASGKRIVCRPESQGVEKARESSARISFKKSLKQIPSEDRGSRASAKVGSVHARLAELEGQIGQAQEGEDRERQRADLLGVVDMLDSEDESMAHALSLLQEHFDMTPLQALNALASSQ